ncbi:hypothetical protein K8I28_03260 [bacterium]|nr:hypothetical protein [bacterium]
MKKVILSVLITLVVCVVVWIVQDVRKEANRQESYRILGQALQESTNGNYTKAIKFCTDAVKLHFNESAYLLRADSYGLLAAIPFREANKRSIEEWSTDKHEDIPALPSAEEQKRYVELALADIQSVLNNTDDRWNKLRAYRQLEALSPYLDDHELIIEATKYIRQQDFRDIQNRNNYAALLTFSGDIEEARKEIDRIEDQLRSQKRAFFLTNALLTVLENDENIDIDSILADLDEYNIERELDSEKFWYGDYLLSLHHYLNNRFDKSLVAAESAIEKMEMRPKIQQQPALFTYCSAVNKKLGNLERARQDSLHSIDFEFREYLVNRNRGVVIP